MYCKTCDVDDSNKCTVCLDGYTGNAISAPFT
jgi:hypothetical protein